MCCRDHSNGYELCNNLGSDKNEYFLNFHCDIDDFYLESSLGSIYLRKLYFGESDTIKVLLDTAFDNLFPGCTSIKKLQTNNVKRVVRNIKTAQANVYNYKSPRDRNSSFKNNTENQTQLYPIFEVAENSELSTAQANITNRLPQNVTSGARQMLSNNATKSQTQPHVTFEVTMNSIAPNMHPSAVFIAKNSFIDRNKNQNDNNYKNNNVFGGVLFSWIVHNSENVHLIPAFILSTKILLFLGKTFCL